MAHKVDLSDGFDLNGALARTIVDTVREPLLVLDLDLRVVVASRSFFTKFKMTPEETQGRMLYDLSEGEWNIAALRLLLDRIVPASEVMDNFEVEQAFPRIGRRTMLLNARKTWDKDSGPPTILLAFDDITEQLTTERALKSLLEQKEMLLAEMSHRVGNSLQIIASILLMKARSVRSEETRHHLEDAHRRVMSVASVQQHLQASAKGEQVDVGSYLAKLCDTLASSMIGDNRAITVDVVAEGGMASSSQAVSLGLIVTELLINALSTLFLTRTPTVVSSSAMRHMETIGNFRSRTMVPECRHRSRAAGRQGSARVWSTLWPNKLTRRLRLQRVQKAQQCVSLMPLLCLAYRLSPERHSNIVPERTVTDGAETAMISP